MRFALALTVAVAGCAATTNTLGAPSAVAPGVKRYGPAVSTVRSLGRRDHGARRPSTSRSLRRRPVSPTNDWDTVAACESSETWNANTGNSFYGGLQFTQTTWASFGGLHFAARADLAPRLAQIAVAERVLRVQGPNAWPVCSRRVSLEIR